MSSNKSTIVKNGFLTKEGYYRKSWKKRWFVLTKDTIRYHKNQTGTKVFGTIFLKDVRRIAPIVNYKKKPHCIEMETPSRTYYMFSATQDDIKSWQDSIQQQVDIINGRVNPDSARIGGDMDETSDSKMTPNDFDMLFVIGKGSFGKVVQVKHKKDGTVYAMKILNKKSIIERGEVQHTQAEQSILKKIRHPFLVNLHFSFQTSEKLYLIMDFVNGGELFYHLQNDRKFDNARARFYAAEIILGLQHLHQQGVIYRDLKPENLLLNASGHICMTDFGLSKQGLQAESARTNTFCGTPEYLAPEVLEGKEYGKGVDWWSFGTLLFEMLTGLPPFYDEDVQKMYTLKMTAKLEVPDYVSADAADLIAKLLVRNPKERLSNVEDIKKHKYFEGLDWDALLALKLKPPYTPRVADKADVGMVDQAFIDMTLTSERNAVQAASNPRGSDAEAMNFPDFTYFGGAKKQLA